MPEQLPTASTPSTTPEVARALAAIEASKLLAEQDVAECLDAIGELITITGAPDTIYAWVTAFLGRESLRQVACQHHITLHESRAAAEEQAARTFVIWTAEGTGMAIVPRGQHHATTLLQLREEIAQRDEELKLARDFQESVAAGHTETLDAWDARVSGAR